jgi:ABC-type lipoprotein release transport system permease subunit
MLVTDKQADIAILRTLGASPRSVMQIFVVQGALIGVIGTLIGVLGGVFLAFNVDVAVPALEQVLGFKFLSKDVYYISELPSEVLPVGRGRRSASCRSCFRSSRRFIRAGARARQSGRGAAL